MALLPLTGIARGWNDAGDPARALALLDGAGVEDPQPRFEPWEIAWAKRELARALKALGREPSRVARLLSSVHETYARFPQIVDPDGTFADQRIAGRH
jgi:hypothetical protein